MRGGSAFRRLPGSLLDCPGHCAAAIRMTRRNRESPTTQRRTMRPHSRLDGGASLVVLQGERLGQRIDLGDEPLMIGRAPDCGLQVADRSVSRQHACLWRDANGYRVKDLGSTNCTLLNDEPVVEAELKDGDHIAIGACVLKFMGGLSVEARYHDEIYQLATLDPLTGMYNRRHFLELLEREMARSTSHARPLALLIADLDHFKSINDRHGHAAGDVVLRQVSGALKACARSDFVFARIGGEEFAMALPEHGTEPATVFARRLCEEVAALQLDEQAGAGRVTISIGVAEWRPGMKLVGDLLRAADERLYRAKQSGRNRVCAQDAP